MNRLIDTMTEVELSRRVLELYSGSLNNVRQDLEALFAPIPCWSDNLDGTVLEEEDNQTWALCFVSDDSAKDTRDARWITSKVYKNGSTLKDSTYEPWEYATPVDLDLRYNNGEDTL